MGVGRGTRATIDRIAVYSSYSLFAQRASFAPLTFLFFVFVFFVPLAGDTAPARTLSPSHPRFLALK
jgi:hypothetical protein